jgi:hypothetical protein
MAGLLTTDSPKIEGYQAVTSLTDPGGFGSYQIQVPQGWLWWVLGADPIDILGIVEEKDPGYAEDLSGLLFASADAGGDALYRGFFIDNDAPYLWALAVLLLQAGDAPLDEVYEFVLSSTEGLEVLRIETFPGEVGGSVEASVRLPAEPNGWMEAVVSHQSFVLDQENGFVWGVSCSVHESALEETYDACWTSIRTFRPFGLMEG